MVALVTINEGEQDIATVESMTWSMRGSAKGSFGSAR
jgi:hypothetical protein